MDNDVDGTLETQNFDFSTTNCQNFELSTPNYELEPNYEINVHLAKSVRERLTISRRIKKPYIRPAKLIVESPTKKGTPSKDYHSAEKISVTKDPAEKTPKLQCLHIIKKIVTANKADVILPRPIGYQSTTCNIFYPHKEGLTIGPLRRKQVKTGLSINLQGKYYAEIADAPPLLKNGGIVGKPFLDANFNNNFCLTIFNLSTTPLHIDQHDIIGQIKFFNEETLHL